MQILPDTHVIQALRNQSLGWSKALGELIDNALDAQALNLTFTAEKSRLTVSDDGRGCANVAAMFTLGDHRPHGGMRGLGRFGIGLKDAALWLWGATHIETVYDGKRYRASVNWDQLCRSKNWEIEDPVVESARGESTGTRITFSQIEKAFPVGKDLDRLANDLGFIFTPAIKNGARIVMRSGRALPRTLERFPVPKLDHVIDGVIGVAGRSVRVHVGVVREGEPNTRPGLHYTHKHRVIIPNSALGCGDSSTSRIFGLVMLSDDWRLSKNKDEVTEYKDELGNAVYEFIKPTLAAAAKQTEAIDLVGLEADLTKLIRGALSPKNEKEHRDPGTHEGTSEPKNTGRKRGAVKRQPGNRLPGQVDAGRLRLEFDESLLPDDGIGVFDVHGQRIRLASRHQYVNSLRVSSQRMALFQLALGLVVNHCVLYEDSGQKLLPGFMSDDQDGLFSRMMGRLMLQTSDLHTHHVQAA